MFLILQRFLTGDSGRNKAVVFRCAPPSPDYDITGQEREGGGATGKLITDTKIKEFFSYSMIMCNSTTLKSSHTVFFF